MAVLVLGASAQAPEDQSRSNQVVGYWRSSTGVDVNLCYSGRADHFLVRTFPQPGRQFQYEAYWTNDKSFFYVVQGDRISGTYDAATDSIRLRNQRGSWWATWRRSH